MTPPKPISEQKSIARTIAILFVATMLMGMVDAYLAAPILRGPLREIYPHASMVLLGAMLRLFMSIGVVGIAIAFLPIVRKYNETVAFAYLAARTAESVLLCLGACVHFFLIGLSRSLVETGSPDQAMSPWLTEAALGFSSATYQMAMTILGLAAAAHTWVLGRTQLLPTWIAGLGFIGYVLVFASASLHLLGVVDTLEGAGAILYVPGGLFELLVLPAWLWTRGFQGPTAAAGEPS